MKKGKRTYKQVGSDPENPSTDPKAPSTERKQSKPKQARSKRQKSSIKTSSIPVIKEIEDLDLFKELTRTSPNISDLIEILDEHIKDHHDIVIRDFLILFLESFGLKDLANQYSEINVLRLEPKELLEKIYGMFDIMESALSMPLFNKTSAEGKKNQFPKNFQAFLRSVFLDSDFLVYKTRVLLSVLGWLKALSICKIRDIRLGVLEIVNFLMKITLELLEKTQTELNRLKSLENDEKVKIYENRLEFIEKFTDELFADVLFPREKDIRLEIRTKFFEILQYVIIKKPDRYLNDKTLSALEAIIFRKNEAESLRNDALGVFLKIYDKESAGFKEFDSTLKGFLENQGFHEKILALALAEKGRISGNAISLIMKMDKRFDKSLSEEGYKKLNKMVFSLNRDVRRKAIEMIREEIFDNPMLGNLSNAEKLTDFWKLILELSEEGDLESLSSNLYPKISRIIEEIEDFLLENCKVDDFFKILLDKGFIKKTMAYKAGFFHFFRVFLEKVYEKLMSSQGESKESEAFMKEFSDFMMKNIENLLKKFKHDWLLLLEIMKLVGFTNNESLTNPENLDTIKLLTKTLGSCLGFIKENDFFEEVCVIMTKFSKISEEFKEIAEELINHVVKDEIENFQSSYTQIYQNLLEIEHLSSKNELFQQIKLCLMRINNLFKFFEIPGFLDDEFVEQVAHAFDRHTELNRDKSKEDWELAGLYLGYMALAHYWKLRDIFQDPDNISNYNNYFRIRSLYYEKLVICLKLEDFTVDLYSQSFSLSVAFISLISNDKMTKLKGIFLPSSDQLFGLILAYLEKFMIFTKTEKNFPFNPFPCIISLFSAPLTTQKLLLSGFGKAISKLFIQEMLWGTRVLRTDVADMLKGLKEKEIINKDTLIFWRLVQDLLFEISEDHILSNTEQLDLGHEVSKLVLKVYFTSGEASEDAKYLEKYVMFMADSIVRGLDKYNNLMNFYFLGVLIYKQVLNQKHMKKLLEFAKIEKRKKEEELEKKGKALDKMENFQYFVKFLATFEKLGKEKKLGKASKTEENKAEKEEKKQEVEEREREIESKKKEIQEEMKERNKGGNDNEMEEEEEEEESKKVLEYNREGRPKRKAQRKKVI